MDDSIEPPRTADYYADLGVSQTASKKEIRKAYLNLARLTHPDKKVDKSADAVEFRRIHEACEFLSDPAKRARYDTVYFGIQDEWACYRQKLESQRKRKEKRATEAQAENERRAAEAERTRKREEQRRAVEEEARRERLREQKARDAEERSRDAARRAWDERQRAAKERIRLEKVAEAERRSEEAAARMRAEQEKTALERLKAARVEEKLNAQRRRWEDMREACESASYRAAPRQVSPIRSTVCAHPQLRWPKRKGRRNCTFCMVVRKKWAFSCPECGASACPACMQEFCQWIY